MLAALQRSGPRAPAYKENNDKLALHKIYLILKLNMPNKSFPDRQYSLASLLQSQSSHTPSQVLLIILADRDPMSEAPKVPSSRPDDRICRIGDETQLINKTDDADHKSMRKEGSSSTILDVDILATKKGRNECTTSCKGKETEHYTPETVVV